MLGPPAGCGYGVGATTAGRQSSRRVRTPSQGSRLLCGKPWRESQCAGYVRCLYGICTAEVDNGGQRQGVGGYELRQATWSLGVPGACPRTEFTRSSLTSERAGAETRGRPTDVTGWCRRSPNHMQSRAMVPGHCCTQQQAALMRRGIIMLVKNTSNQSQFLDGATHEHMDAVIPAGRDGRIPGQHDGVAEPRSPGWAD